MPIRTKPEVEETIVTMLAQRYTHVDIARQTGLSRSGIKKIKRRNAYKLQYIERQLMDWQKDEVKKIKQQALWLINQKLDQEEAGTITLSLAELLAISREMHRQSLEITNS